MADTVPPGQRLDRATLERVILRAAQLQAGEHDLSDGLSEVDLLRLGAEVGIPAPYLRQALLEERTRVVVPDERGVRARLAGPRRLVAERTVPGTAADVRAALEHWMTEGELLAVKRRYADQVAWESQKGMGATLKRSFRVGGREYLLAGASEIVGQVEEVAPGRSHVRLVADLRDSQRSYLGGALTVTMAGAAATGVLLVLGFTALVAVLPAPAAALGGVAIARARFRELERVQTALEQVLDRLEHGEIRPRATAERQDDNPLRWIAREIRRQIENKGVGG
jgi:hypothetical protein